MADVPKEAVRFARMVMRAFYPDEYAVIADGLLRRNNFCSHSDLAVLLCMRPKELRKTMARMTSARLVKSEKLGQRRINYRDEKRPSRVVQTEFWYIPLPELIDAFQYRVDVISRELEARIVAESEQDLYVCQGCGRRYKLVDVCANVDEETGAFYCDAARLDRRVCGGEIREEDNSSRLKQAESFKKTFEEELAPLRELAVRCNSLTIPNHPLEGADKATWDLYVPETIGVRGEVVDEEGLSKELAAEVDGPAAALPPPDPVADAPAPPPTGGDAVAIPDRPTWFKDAAADDDDADEDWEEHDAAPQPAARAGPSFGTGNMFGAGNAADARDYLDEYLRSIGGAKPAQVPPQSAAKPPAVEVPDVPVEDPGDAAEEKPPQSGVSVAVGGVLHPLEDITGELAEKMSDDEYRLYCEAREALGGAGDDDDDDIEFE